MKPTRTLKEAIQRCYVVMRGSYTISNAFFQRCEATDSPFVRVRLKNTLAMVEVDLIGQSYRMGEVCWNEVHDLLRSHHVGNWPHRLAGHSRTCMYSPRILLEDADTVAKGLISILAKPGYREPVMGHSLPMVEALDQALRSGTLEASHSHSKGGYSGISI